jgi:2',3'-cyclic-nucleotide 2'-phosphodiesterase (5'-nucleotidase family)
MIIRAIRFLLVSMMLALGVTFSAAAEELFLGIVHTNDSHGNILPFRGRRDSTTLMAPATPDWSKGRRLPCGPVSNGS